MIIYFFFARKPKTKRSKRFLESRAPKLVEEVKTAMIMKGGNTSQLITNVLKDIVSKLIHYLRNARKNPVLRPAFPLSTKLTPPSSNEVKIWENVRFICYWSNNNKKKRDKNWEHSKSHMPGYITNVHGKKNKKLKTQKVLGLINKANLITLFFCNLTVSRILTVKPGHHMDNREWGITKYGVT